MKLRECPFCGGEAELNGITKIWVRCTQCSVETPFYDFMDEAEDAWNRRVGDDLMERMEDDGK